MVATLTGGLVASCAGSGASGSGQAAELGAGVRYSTYGPTYDPGADYWLDVGGRMSDKFDGATPQAIWIVANYGAGGTTVLFPGKSNDPKIHFIDKDDNEEVLDLFDENGMQVWLQIEPGHADVDEVFRLVLDQYAHHQSVIGIGLDVEWYKGGDDPYGVPVTDEEAERWLALARGYSQNYQLFFKHWDSDWMPPTARDGLVFIDDSQFFDSAESMVAEFVQWADHFAPAKVGFQYGYPDDKHWWGDFDDPAGEIGKRLLAAAPNTSGLFWVDFTAIEVFPPDQNH